MNRENVLRYLTELPPDKVLSGQMVGHGFYNLAAEYTHNFVELAAQTGQYPAIIGASYGVRMTDETHQRGNQVLIDYWNAGGLIEVNWACDNPWTLESYQDPTRTALADLLDPTTEVSATWDVMVERVVGHLFELRDADVVVLWRPFGEPNYTGANWWDAHTEYWSEPERVVTEYVALWRDLYQRLTVQYGLDNLIWVYSPSHFAAEWIPASVFYPGDEYVDIAGFNWYSDDYPYIQERWGDLLGLGKPVALTECGPRATRDGAWDAATVLRVLDFAPVRWFMFWASWPEKENSIIDCQNASGLMNDSRVVNRGEVDIEMSLMDRINEVDSAIVGVDNALSLLIAQMEELRREAAEADDVVDAARDTLTQMANVIEDD